MLALARSLGFAIALVAVTTAHAAQEWKHATSLTGEPKYAQGFAHYDYVNPDAPKGGLVRLAVQGSFDTFNPILPKGEIANGIGLIYETLMTSSLDELDVSAQYGLIAEEISYPDDFSSVSFRLHPDAKWHDGRPITVEDVIWSFQKAVELNPSQACYYRNVTGAEKTGEREVTFRFDVKNNRELPHIMGQILVLPKHWWTGQDARGNARDIARGTLEPPLGSGPYRIGRFDVRKFVEYERVPDAWANDLNVNVGQHNFGRIRYDFYLDGTVLAEAFKGDQYDWRIENSAKTWSNAYEPQNFPGLKDGRAIKEIFDDPSGARPQFFVLNNRREKFKDPRVREAMSLLLDFESLNRTVFYDLYLRNPSYFAGTELAQSGLPEGRELEILEEVRGQVPEEVFTSEFENPVGGDPRRVRDNLRRALDLFREAGWELQGRRLMKDGRQFTVEYLDASATGERVALPYGKAMERLGIDFRFKRVDTATYINRLRDFDFDMITQGFGQSLSPGNEQRDYWGSEAATRPASRNVTGIADPAVDLLIDRVIFAKSREDLVAATRALDRVLMWNHYNVPQLYYPYTRTVRWDRFGRPDELPKYTPGFPTIWWYDEERASKTGRAG